MKNSSYLDDDFLGTDWFERLAAHAVAVDLPRTGGLMELTQNTRVKAKHVRRFTRAGGVLRCRGYILYVTGGDWRIEGNGRIES